MARTLPAAAVLAAGLLLAACGSSSLLSADSEAEITIKSAVNGQTFSPGDKIVLAVGGEPDRLTVTVAGTDGTVVGTASIDEPRGGDAVVELSQFGLRPGQYRARFALQSDGAALAEKSLVFFVGPAGPRMAGIESRPPIIFAGSTVELSVVLAAAAGVDPFLRWTENRRTFASGPASAGGARVKWEAPREPGVYSVRVELFPVTPAEGVDFPFASSVRTTTELYVSVPAPARGLGPAESYWMLYDFDGSLRDRARGGVEAQAVGTIEPVAGAEALGYRIASPSGIRIGRSLFPAEPLPGFTVSIGLTLSAATPGALILTSRCDQLALSVTLGPDGSPTALLRSPTGERTLLSGLGPVRAGERHHLDLSFARTEQGSFAMWFLDGEPGAVTQLGDEVPPAASGAGETLIGGPGGISGVVDELGVYCRDSQGRPGPDPEVFARAMSDRHGDALLLADGFDGSRLGGRYKTEGEVSVSLGALALAPGASVELELPRPPEGEIVLETACDRELAVGWQGRTLRLSALGARVAADLIRVRIGQHDGQAGDAAHYRLVLAAAADEPLSVASLLAYVE